MIFYQESNFKDGFTAGFIGSASGSAMGGGTQWNNIAKRTAIAATAGGIATELGGGKFANGAQTAAFVHLFNAEGGNIGNALKQSNLPLGGVKCPYQKPPTMWGKITTRVADYLIKTQIGVGGVITKSIPARFFSTLLYSKKLGDGSYYPPSQRPYNKDDAFLYEQHMYLKK